ncbi:MAG: 3-isopropylmalate dehydratase small subunit [Deltaproteobacteria bacterium]|nr:3-isopropylmalate dehydratase small subunit [Deltaproteobacteria bacterium]
MKIEGRVWKFGDDVDTDLIIPARYLNISDGRELARHVFADVRPDFAGAVTAGDIIVAGRNFGCGSSREHAPLALKAAGIRAVIARSFARIFYRNAFNIGLPLMESGEAEELLQEGEKISVDLSTGKIENMTSHKTCSAQRIPDFMRNLVQTGGLVEHVRQNKLKKKTVRR